MSERFYCPDPPVAGRLTLSGDEARHLATVRRFKAGQAVEVFDGRGRAFEATIVDIQKGSVELAVGAPVPDRSPPCRLTLATAVPKGERFDWLIEKATELGVARLVPLRTERSVVDPRAAKLDRVRRIVIEASKQCGRNTLMELSEPIPFADLLRAGPADVRLIAHPGGRPAADWPKSGNVALAIGPEGGFAPTEIEAAEAAGWVPAGLGSTVLRVETAALAGSALIMARGAGGGS